MATRHHSKHIGLQNHSVGELYPWSVVRIGDRCEQPRQLVSGETGPEFPLLDFGDGVSAYQQAEKWIRERIASEQADSGSAGKYVDGMRELGELAYSPDGSIVDSVLANHYDWPAEPVFVEYRFLLPIEFANGQFVPASQFSKLESKLVDTFGGYSKQAGIVGQWVDDSGLLFSDTSIQYSIGIEPRLLGLLETIVEQACTDWQQACVYLAKSSESVKFIR